MHLKKEAEVHQGPGVCLALYISWVKESGASCDDGCVNMMQLLCALSCKSSPYQTAGSGQGTAVIGHFNNIPMSVQVDDFILDYVI